MGFVVIPEGMGPFIYATLKGSAPSKLDRNLKQSVLSTLN